MDMALRSCTGGDLTQPPSGDAQVVQAIGMQLGALAQATELLAEAAFVSSSPTRDVLSVDDYSKKAPHKKRTRRNRPRNRGSKISKQIKKGWMPPEAAHLAAVVQEQAATGEGEPHHMRRRDRRRKRGSGAFKKAWKQAFSEVGQALTLVL